MNVITFKTLNFFREKTSLQNETLFDANFNRKIFLIVIIYNNFCHF